MAFNLEGSGPALIYRHTDGHTFTAVAIATPGREPGDSRIHVLVERAVLRAHLEEALRLLDVAEMHDDVERA